MNKADNTSKNGIDFSTVLASSVHDMKNSIGMLLSSVETILDEMKPETPEQERHFHTLHYEASRINGELIQLLTLYRMENGFLPLHIDEHFPLDVIEDQVARNQLLIDTSNIDVTVDCSPDLAWYFDTDLVGGVIHNVLVNGIRYTRQRIHIAVREEQKHLVVSIADDGDGFPDDMLVDPANRVFEASLSEGATHLGLFFASEIARLHKQGEDRGRIALMNGGALGGGEFRLILP